MTTNREWLFSLEPSELSAWFDADCFETENTNKLTAERDAAYAKNRALKQHIANMQEGRNGWHTKAEKLQAKVTELTSERNELQAQVGELFKENDALVEERSNLQKQLRFTSAEREHYRSICSNMATKIHDALMVMDEGMA